MTKRITTGIHIWQNYWGALLNDSDNNGTSIIYGFENLSQPNKQKTSNYLLNIKYHKYVIL